MAIIFAEVVNHTGLSVTRDSAAPGLLYGTGFYPKNFDKRPLAGLVLADELKLRLAVHDDGSEPSCELEESLRKLSRSTPAIVVPDEINVSYTMHKYTRRKEGVEYQGPHQLVTVRLGGTAILEEFEGFTPSISIRHMTLHAPTDRQLDATPCVNLALLGVQNI